MYLKYINKTIVSALLGCILCIGCNQTQPVQPLEPIVPVTIPTVETALLDAHNKERFKDNLSALSISKELTVAAAKHCQWMATNNKLSHKESFRSTMESRIRDEKYDYRSCGENIAEGQPTVKEVMDTWMKSSGHRKNIMDKHFTDVGFGVVNEGGKIWWCVDFGEQRENNRRPIFPILPRGESD